METTLNPDEYLPCEWVPVDALTANQYNPNSMTDRERALLRRSIQNHGYTEPIVVHSEDLFIIDGEQRWTVAQHEDIQEDADLTPPGTPPGYVPVFGIEVEGDEARVSTIQHNRARGVVDLQQMGDYADTFDAEELSEMGLNETEVFELIDEDPTETTDNEMPDEIVEPDEVRTDPTADTTAVDAPALPSADTVSILCSPAEQQFIEAVFHDGDTLDAYIEVIEEYGLEGDVREIIGG